MLDSYSSINVFAIQGPSLSVFSVSSVASVFSAASVFSVAARGLSGQYPCVLITA